MIFFYCCPVIGMTEYMTEVVSSMAKCTLDHKEQWSCRGLYVQFGIFNGTTE
jgi:hypothetical protein